MMDQPALRPAFRSRSVGQGHSPEKRQERDAQLYASNRIPGVLAGDLRNLHSFRYEREREIRLLPTSNADCKEDDCHVVTEKG